MNGHADLRGFEWHHLWTLCHRERHELVEGASCLTAVAISADGGTLATGSLGVVTLRDPASGETWHTFSGLGVWIQGLAFSPDSKTLAAVGGTSPKEPGRVYLWDLKTRELKHVFFEHTGYIRGVAFSTDGAVLATGGDDKQVRLWNVDTLNARGALDGHEGSIMSLAFHPRKMRLVSGGTDGTVRIWDFDDMENPRVLNATATSLAFSAHEDMATASSNTVRLWDFDTGVEKSHFELAAGSIRSLAFDPDGATRSAPR
jgi:WD40 repeat protein